jgi:spore germination protein
MFLHIVKPKDTLFEISKGYGVPIDRLVLDNDLANPDVLVVGQSLLIRRENFKYRVVAGDTIYSLAKKYGITVDQIMLYNNQIESPDKISPGMEIKIVFDNPDKVPMEINGFTYIDIKPEVLKKTLPYLTYLSIFSYPVNADGTLGNIEDEELIREAYRFNVAPILVVTNMDAPGNFSSDLIHDILVNEKIQTTLIDEVYRVIQEKGYQGVNFDFEYIYPEDKDNYNAFLEKTVAKLNPRGYKVMTSLAPKTGPNQPGLLYEAHDYEAQGDIVNRIVLMTYEWGFLYGPSMPVAPINKVEEVISYAVTVIPSEKILMGMPNYGYDFPVPFVQGQMAKILTNNEAIALASRVSAKIEFDLVAKSPYFVYHENDREHNVHFEDARSTIAKINLAKEYDLGGLSYWTIMDFFTPNWLLVDYYIDVIKVL